MKFNKTAIRSISATLVLAQLSLAMQPLMAATREDKGASSPMAQAQLKQMQALQRNMDEARASKAQAAQSPADRASAQLARIEELVRDLDDLRGQLSGESSTREQERAIGPMMKAKVRPLTADQKTQLQNRRDALWNELRGLLAKQADDQAAVRAEFAQNRQMLIDRKLPQVIMQRHDDAVRDFEQHVAQFNRSLSSLSANPEAAAAELKGFFDQYPTTRRAAPVDPKNLPWRTPEPTKRMPAETQTAWFQNLYGREGTRLAQTGNNLEGLTFITPPEAGTAPTATDLAETPETQRTPAIVAKAKELGNNPVNIQNWVRNNVEWVPTWGAIQSAQDTLDKKRGNAIDIASLQIALLRAAKIPARYQFGTIELPAEQVMNWVGGVSKPEAAQQLLGQGGIANRGLIEGGKISKIRMEHAWVQAYVNWVPSRGSKQGNNMQHPNPQPQRNAWIPLDSSFKQYVSSPIVDLTESLETEMQRIKDAAAVGIASNDDEGWVRSVDHARVQAALQAYKNRLNQQITSEKDARVGAYVGRKIVPATRVSILQAKLPFLVMSESSPIPIIGSSLQHKFKYRLYLSNFDRIDGVTFLEYEAVLSQLAGKSVLLTYVPATDADRSAMVASLPKAQQNGSPVAPEEFSRSLPAYLIRVKAQIRVDGVVKAESSPVSMGQQFISEGGFTSNDLTSWDFSQEQSNVAGQVAAIGISAAGISQVQIDQLNGRLRQVRQKLEAQSYEGLSAEKMVPDLMTSVIWTWFFQSESNSRLAQAQANIVSNPGLSYGLYQADANPVWSWGVIRRVDYSGFTLDIGHVRQLSWSKDNSIEEFSRFNRAVGYYMSALEHLVPESFLRDPAIPVGAASQPRGVSAVRAIEVASLAGQRIYTIDQKNAQAMNLIQIDSASRQRMQSVIDVGGQVVVHEAPVSVGGWSGSGYIALDENGAGAYMLSGGANGGKAQPPGVNPYSFWMFTSIAGAFADMASFGNMSAGLNIYGYIDSILGLGECSDPIAAELGLFMLTALTLLGLLLVAIVALSSVIASILVGAAYGLFMTISMEEFGNACKK